MTAMRHHLYVTQEFVRANNKENIKFGITAPLLPESTSGRYRWIPLANITMTSKGARWRPKSRLFTQPFIQAQIKENIKAPRHWPLCGEFTGDQ